MAAARPKYMAVQAAALIIGAALVVLAVLGCLPGVTAQVDQLGWVGQHSQARLFGVFVVSWLHNGLNLVVGVCGLVMSRSYAAARAFFLGGGLVYLALWMVSMMRAHTFDWLYFGVGVVMVILGVTLAGQHDPTKRRRRIRA